MFNWDEFYTTFKVKMEHADDCTVGRYVTPKEDSFPYVDVALSDNRGSAYDLRGYESAENPMIEITVYDTGSLADGTCISLSEEAKKIMLSYGFQCITGPIPVTNADTTIMRWVTRYERVFAKGEVLEQVNYSDTF